MKNSIYPTTQKNGNKILLITTIIILILALIIIFIFNFFLGSRTIKIKTKYGDHFTVSCGDFFDFYDIRDDNSYFHAGLDYFSDKDQLKAVCDNQYIRCYLICDTLEDGYKDLYILKIKEYDEFFAVRCGDEKNKSDYMGKENAEKVKRVFLCDDLLVEICIGDLDYLYHDEMEDILDKLNNHEYEELEKYGLTKEMTEDTESLNKKTTIIKNYLVKADIHGLHR
ncbi:hypothetical protein [Ruminococcus flavefaciens]|uniref:hypothetical protein n=1 Tax=Ruminococcus flavefaciens TaxID=1265 RepID=UPI0002FC0A57|nr:hypothetical protein [Ruminococcus flavefaciens]